MTNFRSVWIVSSLLLACGSTQQKAAPNTSMMPAPGAVSTPPAGDVAKPETVAADSPRATAAGTTFTAPAGWTLYADGASRILAGPEKDVKLAIIDVPQASDAEDAVKRAWPTLDPAFKRPVRLAQDRPPRFGWEASRVFVYETSPNEHRSLTAMARRRGTAWSVLLLDGSEAGEERGEVGRGAERAFELGPHRARGGDADLLADDGAHESGDAGLAAADFGVAVGREGLREARFDRGERVQAGVEGVDRVDHDHGREEAGSRVKPGMTVSGRPVVRRCWRRRARSRRRWRR